MTNYIPDIIATIETEALNYAQKYGKVPPVALNAKEYQSYQKELKAGRRPIITWQGKEIIVDAKQIDAPKRNPLNFHNNIVY